MPLLPRVPGRRCDLASKSFRTILSYDCPSGLMAPRVGVFSSPALSVNGYPAGTEDSANCARAIWQVRGC